MKSFRRLRLPRISHLSAPDSVEFTKRLVPHLRTALGMERCQFLAWRGARRIAAGRARRVSKRAKPDLETKDASRTVEGSFVRSSEVRTDRHWHDAWALDFRRLRNPSSRSSADKVAAAARPKPCRCRARVERCCGRRLPSGHGVASRIVARSQAARRSRAHGGLRDTARGSGLSACGGSTSGTGRASKARARRRASPA